MNTNLIRWGIIGCGDVTEVKSGPAFNKVPNSSLIAVMRRNEEKAKDYARRHSVPKWYGDAEQLINDPEVDAIYVATPPANHEDYAIKAMRAGKPVYVEKPVALNAAAAKRMKDVSEETGTKITSAHYRRQQPLFLKIKELLQQKAIGDVRMIEMKMWQPHQSNIIAQCETNWRVDPAISGGGLFYDLAPHQLDLMLYFFGNPIKVSGISFNTSRLDDVDDTTAGQVLFGSNCVFNGSWCFASYERMDRCDIIGSEGKMSFSVFDPNPLVIDRQGTITTMEFDKLQHVQQPMIEKVVQYFLGNSANPCSITEGLEVMRMIDKMAGKQV